MVQVYFLIFLKRKLIKTIKSNENNAVSLSQQIQNERSERLNPVENFNDELKRRLAGRSNFPSSKGALLYFKSHSDLRSRHYERPSQRLA